MRDTPSDPRPPGQPAWSTIALHAVAAAAFFFTLNYLAMRTSLTTSLVWGGAGAVGAAWLAYSQGRRDR